MIFNQLGHPVGPMSMSERMVADSLNGLPNKYKIDYRPLSINLINSWREGNPIFYEPDFVVVNEYGKSLVVEVKSESSLSLVNMVRFSEIDEMIRSSGGNFLLLVVASGRSKSQVYSFPEFGKISISFVSSPLDVHRAIEDNFSRNNNW